MGAVINPSTSSTFTICHLHLLTTIYNSTTRNHTRYTKITSSLILLLHSAWIIVV